MEESKDFEDERKEGSFPIKALFVGFAVAAGAVEWHRRRRRRLLNSRLEKAVLFGNKKKINELLKKGVDVNHKDAYGNTMRALALKDGLVDVAKHLEAKGARTDISIPHGNDACDRIMDVKSKKAKASKGSLVVLLAKDGKVLYEKAVGYSDRFSRTKANLDTMYCVGSVTKQFVAAAILKLEEQGKLHVSDKLDKYYPEFAHGKAADITIHHLLTHTSGIHTYISFQFLDRIVNELVDAHSVIKEVAGIPLDFKPGEKFLYSNSGYMILGEVVKKVSGMSLEDAFSTFFFEPLGMTRTTLRRGGGGKDNVARDSLYGGKPYKEITGLNVSWSRRGSGGLYSTVGDMMLWNEKLFGGEVLAPETLKRAFTPVKLGDGSSSHYGYGWQLRPADKGLGFKCIYHGGAMNGFRARLVRLPDLNITFVAVSNRRLIGNLALLSQEHILKYLQPRPEVIEYAPANLSDVIKKFEGLYDFGPDVDMFKIAYNKGFFFETDWKRRQQLVLTDGGRVLVCRKYLPILRIEALDSDKNGRASKLQASRESSWGVPRTGTRIKEVKPTREELKRFVGDFDKGMKIFLRKKKLYLKSLHFATEGLALPLRPVTKSKFRTSLVYHVSLEEHESDAKKVTKIKCTEANAEIILSRVTK